MSEQGLNPRIIVGITGSSGASLGVHLLAALRTAGVETHLVITDAARLTIQQETHLQPEEVIALADRWYENADIGAAIASGSFRTNGMVIIPCSIKTLSAVANSYTDNLLCRAADVTLKEGRPLILAVREAPLHFGHIRLMKLAARAGAIIFPPVPAFYAHPWSVGDIVQNITGRILGRLGIPGTQYYEWRGMQNEEKAKSSQYLLSRLLTLPAMTLATVGNDDCPYAASLYFVADEDLNLYFLSMPGTQHGENISGKSEAAITIQPIVSDWRDICGLQLRGRVEQVIEKQERDQAWQLYVKKFPFCQNLQGIVNLSSFYVFRPDWVRVINNAQGFGHKEEWEPGKE